MTGEKEKLSYFEMKVMLALSTLGKATPERIMNEGKFTRLVEVMNASSWLQMKGMVEMEEKVQETVSLSRKSSGGKDLPERTGIKFLKKCRVPVSMGDFNAGSGLPKGMPSIAIGWMRRKGWVDISKDGNETYLILSEKGRDSLSKKGGDELLIKRLFEKGEIDVEEVDANALSLLSRRKDVIVRKERILRFISLTDKGREIVREGLILKKQVGQITPELLQSGEWGQVELRPYDIDSFAPAIYGGKENPLGRLIRQIRKIFLDMGFSEIWGNYVEPAFWIGQHAGAHLDHKPLDISDMV